MTNDSSSASTLVSDLTKVIENGKPVTAAQVFSYLDHHQVYRPEDQTKVLQQALAECQGQSEQSDCHHRACAVITDCLKQVSASESAGASSAGEA